MQLPIKHLSARVPWHDSKWNGCICKNPADNSFCRVLPMIDADKDVEGERDNCGKSFADLDALPPCVGEKGSFMNRIEHHRQIEHNYKKRYNNKLFKDFLPIDFTCKPYSFSAVPYRWMLKDRENGKSEVSGLYNLEFDADAELRLREIMGFKTNWVQDYENQKILLNSFFSSLQPNKSLVFFYARHTPLSEVGRRVLIGVAYITHIGELIDFNYPNGYTGHRSFAWERLITHSLKSIDNGCLLPYHELIEHEKDNPEDSFLCRDCIVEVPEYSQFSHASELVENDTAIDALFAMQMSLHKTSKLLGESYSKQLEWLDQVISQVWNMRGVYPSMGSVLAAMGFVDGLSIAWQIEQHIFEVHGDIYAADAWDIFDELVAGKTEISGLTVSQTMRTRWTKAISENDKKQMKLLSRIQLNNEQAKYAVEQEGLLESPYVLFENSRRGSILISFSAIDKAMYPIDKIIKNFPLTETDVFNDSLDIRRIRALVVSVLEDEADKGHTLITEDTLINACSEKTLSEPVVITKHLLRNYCDEKYFSKHVHRLISEESAAVLYYKLVRFQIVKDTILKKFNFELIQKRTLTCDVDFRGFLDSTIGEPFDENDVFDLQSRTEKVKAMAVLARYRMSVLVGPAGSGKTTLLKAFCSIPEIAAKGVVLLAPTGKARVNISESAQTIAQFLYKSNRYDIFSGQYRINPTEARTNCGTLIIDEASMLTEEQLASILDAVIYERFILVGDYRQLPPIGAGRPFFDLVQRLKPLNETIGMAYAELTNISRQKSSEGKPRGDIALSRFYGDAQKFDYEGIGDVLSEIAMHKYSAIDLVRWDTGEDLKSTLLQVLKENLKLNNHDLQGSFEDKALGRTLGKFFNYDYAENTIEKWQILSPVNGHLFGVKEINKLIQKEFRLNTIIKALQPWSHIPDPQGRDNFVYGDKVINLGNRTIRPQRVISKDDKKRPLCYMANGEIGSVVGQYTKSDFRKKPFVWISFSSQPGYAYSFSQGSFDEGEKSYDFELAYCISVHKSQGSGFGIVFLILPANNPLLSRELLYTALTRQKDKIVILHQGEFAPFLRYAGEEYSETGRRLTDLFHVPQIIEFEKKHYDSRYVNITLKGEPVISKSEALIANILYSFEKQGLLSYAYENKLVLKSGRSIKPDFIIDDLQTGRKFYWEHLGLLTKQDYKEKWLLKRQAYLDEGIVPAEESTIEDNVILITSEDSPLGGLNSLDVEKKLQEYVFNI